MMKPTTTNNQENTEAILPSFFYAIASSESRPLTSWEELERFITKDPLTQARTLEYRQRLAISKQLAQEVKIQMPGITVAALMDGYGKEMRNIKKVLRNIALDYDHVDAQLMEECIRKAKADPHTKVLFVTASGRGFRIIASSTAWMMMSSRLWNSSRPTCRRRWSTTMRCSASLPTTRARTSPACADLPTTPMPISTGMP